MKQIALIPLLLASYSGAVEYTSFANTVEITPENINIKMLQMGDDEPSCLEEGISFPLGQIYSSPWLDTVVLARQQQQFLNFNYDEDTCLVASITMPTLFNEGTGNAITGDLEETGLNGNVALLGTNGLTEGSIYSSEHYRTDEATAAFDGYIYNEQFNDDAVEKISRGIWLTDLTSGDGERVSPWVEIDYGYPVTLSGLGIFINARSQELGRLPRYVTVMTSDDGEEFEELVTYTLSNAESNRFDFNGELNARFYKLRFDLNFGDNFIEIDEIELYQ